jgi:hypothetical protein
MNKQRLVGVDLCRGFATYAVVLLHSGDVSWAPIGYWALEINSWFNFAVPFFLATSFYFIVGKLPIGLSWNFWKPKLERLVIPYIIWTIFYCVTKTLMFLILKQDDKLNQLFHDPISIIFCGAASIQLYYLPLLFIGILSLIVTADPLAKRKVRINILLSVLVIFTIIAEGILSSGNSFDLGSTIAFKNLIYKVAPHTNDSSFMRILLVNLSWAFRCLPYIFMAMILIKKLPRFNNSTQQKTIIFISLFSFIFIQTIGRTLIPFFTIRELLSAYSLLILGLYISPYIKYSLLIAHLGICSFGIYLIHPIFIQVTEIFIGKFIPDVLSEVSLTSKLLFSIPTFLMSWLAVSTLMRNKFISKYMFGT